ncbi:hypothetical protein CALVIDRAFT_560685 [Calocera viscosa TUFC12733]|uniref:Uncharacterized protein n=1 Tax=Calocera viscosa (strain TUFC12733) TaxID=1330018 RepID=A0A167QMS9_CALVF|nr:hypothetical protein CALVIDRAFT_560685 [Calocera viscosa TUFC12733]
MLLLDMLQKLKLLKLPLDKLDKPISLKPLLNKLDQLRPLKLLLDKLDKLSTKMSLLPIMFALPFLPQRKALAPSKVYRNIDVLLGSKYTTRIPRCERRCLQQAKHDDRKLCRRALGKKQRQGCLRWLSFQLQLCELHLMLRPRLLKLHQPRQLKLLLDKLDRPPQLQLLLNKLDELKQLTLLRDHLDKAKRLQLLLDKLGMDDSIMLPWPSLST